MASYSSEHDRFASQEPKSKPIREGIFAARVALVSPYVILGRTILNEVARVVNLDIPQAEIVKREENRLYKFAERLGVTPR